MPTQEEVLEALSGVEDPEINKPITDLGMVDEIVVDGSQVAVAIKLTVPGCPMKDRIDRDVRGAVTELSDVEDVHVKFGSMTDEERKSLSESLRAERGMNAEEPEIVFAQPDNPTNVIAVASGKGGVGKSSVTVNLGVALARQGYRVGILDADIWGYSIPRMLGVEGQPVAFEGMVMPLQGHGCKVISIGFFTQPDRSVLWRGPMLHRALQQFLTDIYWGELDFLLCDLPPGTGDVAISMAQMLPNADMLVVTTPQLAAQKVALRAGKGTEQTGMRVAGVIENMATFTCPDCGTTHDIFGAGGGQALADELDTELLGRIPMDPRLREGSDSGEPLVVSDPDVPASQALTSVADTLAKRAKSVVGKKLPFVS